MHPSPDAASEPAVAESERSADPGDATDVPAQPDHPGGDPGEARPAVTTAVVEPARRRRHELWEAHAWLGRGVDVDTIEEGRLRDLLDLTDDVLRLEAEDRERVRAAEHRLATRVVYAATGASAVIAAVSLVAALIGGWGRAWTVTGLTAALLTGVAVAALHRSARRGGGRVRARCAVGALLIGVLLAAMVPFLPKRWAVALMMTGWAGLLVVSWLSRPGPTGKEG